MVTKPVLPNIGKLTKLAFGFLMIYTAYTSTANICSLIFARNGYGTLGFYSVGILYISWGLGGIFTASMCRYLGHKWSIVVSTLGNAFWCYAAILTINPLDENNSIGFGLVIAVVLFTSSINGVFSGPMWVTACKFISSCAPNKD